MIQQQGKTISLLKIKTMKNTTYQVFGWNSSERDYCNDKGSFSSLEDALAHSQGLEYEFIVDEVIEDNESGEITSKTIYESIK